MALKLSSPRYRNARRDVGVGIMRQYVARIVTARQGTFFHWKKMWVKLTRISHKVPLRDRSNAAL